MFSAGEWEIDPAANEVRRGSVCVRVEPKAMQVLAVLARESGRVVSREALLAEVWPGVIVGDEALTQAIIKLRKALGDTARSPRYLETISKRGYRLVAPVTVESDRATAQANPPEEKEPAIRRSRSHRSAVLAAMLAVLVVAVAVFALRSDDPRPAMIVQPILDERTAVTVAIAPFEALGPETGHAYLARGIGDDLATDLARIPGLVLVGLPGAESAERVGSRARYVVSGTVQREGAALRVNARLVDARTGEQVWAERFDRAAGDLFALQDDLVRSITAVLPGRLAEAARRSIAHRYTRSLEAYDLFLRAQTLFLVRQPGVNDEARELYRRALALDPKFARAYAGLAMTYAMDQRLRGPGEAANALSRAFELAESARLIDPDIPEVYWALAFVHAQSRRHAEALRALAQAISLNPSYADAYAFMGGIHTYRGDAERSIPLLRTALRLNPQGGYLYFMLLGRAYLYTDDAEQAIINLREAAGRNAADVETRILLAAALAANGEQRAAEWEAVEIRALMPRFSRVEWLGTYPLETAAYRTRLAGLLERVGL